MFGNIVHQAFAQFFVSKGEPVKCFQEMWNFVRPIMLDYSERDSWEKLKGSGEALLRKLLGEELPKLGNISAADVFAVPVPEPTPTCVPLSYESFLARVEKQLAVDPITIVDEKLALAKNGQRLFGLLELQLPGVEVEVAG